MSDQIHGPSDTAPQVTYKVARCKVCHTQWQVKSFAEPPTDAQTCPFCGAGQAGQGAPSPITIISEAPGYEGYEV